MLWTEAEQYERLVGQVRRRIAADPDRERETLRRIFREHGYAEGQVESLIATLSSNEAGWARTMMIEEFGLAPVVRSPWVAAGSTYAAFLLCGVVPLLPYIVGLGFATSAVMTGVVFFVIGSLRSVWTDTSWLRSGLVTLAIGGAAAIMAYGLGYLLRLIVGDVAIKAPKRIAISNMHQ